MARINPNKIINAINKAIAVNPTDITFTMTVKKEVDGAFENETVDKTIMVLIYIGTSTNSVNISINSGVQGISYTSRYKMIADKDAGLDVKPTQSIKFTSNGDKFEIKAVYPIIMSDTICGYECDLDRID
ncbi:MAG: hypothetical protein LKE46_01845 [Clostridium sp.]|jgi:hypothetical protein|uniref:hypothetical protein n=1 Tax=Clostridium sp. TaxID=1506 RepID=UPI0025C232D1|nr:hypothetical protein [Clostridium sp.]MCH3962993.1 hypothetical protein [Clostridium sp.]MCI1800202.1 hypothetical protein [Clostridium sp.]MCI2202072.1 hypothetical protein [Clostridium sp.]